MHKRDRRGAALDDPVDLTVDKIGRSPRSKSEAKDLRKEILGIIKTARKAEAKSITNSEYPDSEALSSARNFAHYLGIRSIDLRKLQSRLDLEELGGLFDIDGVLIDSEESHFCLWNNTQYESTDGARWFFLLL